MLKRLMLTLVVVVLGAGLAQADDWQVDPVHSKVIFKVSHLVISKVVGTFGEFSANLSFDGADVAGGKVDMKIAVASVDTDNEDRNKHLVSAEFFDAEKFPEITFKSKQVIKGDGKEFQLVGDLTIKGVTKEVTFDCEFHGSAEFMGATKTGFTATAEIDRQEFGVSWNRSLDAGGVVVGNKVEITLELEFNKSDDDA